MARWWARPARSGGDPAKGVASPIVETEGSTENQVPIGDSACLVPGSNNGQTPASTPADLTR